MKFWTVQKKEIINVVDKNGIFYSDFAKSNYVKLNPNLKDLYDLVLKSFNDINNLNLKGLIFAFSQSDNQSLYEIDNFTSFYSFIQNKRAVIESLWNELSSKDAVILELNYDDNFNPIFLDINDFQFLMPPIFFSYPFAEQDIERICWSIENGIITRSVFPSNVIQAHLPYIKAENIVNIYSMFDFE